MQYNPKPESFRSLRLSPLIPAASVIIQSVYCDYTVHPEQRLFSPNLCCSVRWQTAINSLKCEGQFLCRDIQTFLPCVEHDRIIHIS